MNGKRVLLFIVLLIFIFCFFIFLFSSYEAVWKLWSIPTMMPPFADLRVTISGAESFASGHDPLYHKPENPYGIGVNYPRIWYYISVFGINQSHTNYVAGILIILFLMGSFIFVKKFSSLTAVILSLVIFSPAVMFGFERGNTDLVVFIIFALALAAARASTIASLILVIFASFLKFYPIVGLGYLLKENRKRFWYLLLFSSCVFLIYFLYNLRDFNKIVEGTYWSSYMSYGIKILPAMVYGHLNSDLLRDIASIFTYIFIIVLIVTSLILTCNNYESEKPQRVDYIDAFRVGACIYIGTFVVIGHNWDYKLMFLIFTIPQIVSWATDKQARHSFIPKLTLSGIIILCWHLVLWKRLPWETPILLLDELFNWIVLSGLIYLFIASIPLQHRRFIDRLIYSMPIRSRNIDEQLKKIHFYKLD